MKELQNHFFSAFSSVPFIFSKIRFLKICSDRVSAESKSHCMIFIYMQLVPSASPYEFKEFQGFSPREDFAKQNCRGSVPYF